ncbi:MAG: DUF99 family protein [Candidatus Methanoperedens sp.]|nr:DUF99 family protein [Candidatus Methanoperedens sp.]
MKSNRQQNAVHIKSQIRILAIDDSPLIHEKVMIIGAFFRGGEQLDGILRGEITRDGMDSTDVLIRMINNSKFHTQIRVILLDGVTYAGFNPVDITNLFKETGIPVISFMRSCPNLGKIRLALLNIPDSEKRMEIIQRAGKIFKIDQDNPVFFQVSGIDRQSAVKIIRMTSTHSNIPEPLRVAHLIATGLVLGESKGKA